MQLQEGAIFIADAHFFPEDKKAFILLDSLLINPPIQIFFVGDIFHILVGNLSSSTKLYQSLLDKIHLLSQKTQVIYLEGNHDFGIPQKLLPLVKIFKRNQQPLQLFYKNKIFLLAHGDLFISPLYHLYIHVITHPSILLFLKILDWLTYGKIYLRIHKKIIKKPIFKLKNTKNFTEKRIFQYKKYSKKYHLSFEKIIEGHFHTSMQTKNYIALPSFYCHKKIVKVINEDFIAFIA